MVGRVLVHATMSLDGFIAGPDHAMDWVFAVCGAERSRGRGHQDDRRHTRVQAQLRRGQERRRQRKRGTLRRGLDWTSVRAQPRSGSPRAGRIEFRRVSGPGSGESGCRRW